MYARYPDQNSPVHAAESTVILEIEGEKMIDENNYNNDTKQFPTHDTMHILTSQQNIST